MNERAIFIAALHELDPARRAALLSRACGEDRALRGRVEELLREQEQLGSFLERPAGAPGDTGPFLPTPADQVPPSALHEPNHAEHAAWPAAAGEGPGGVIGDYKLLEQIGEGGFGIVFMAEQTQPIRRKVALKVLKPGMDTRSVVARFEAERQALALMDHPNIAQVYDGGETVTGRPYFVMELVRGVPITDFCDQNQQGVRERLELFVRVCQAVQHAHQKGIIHRDIKPSNVLVTLHEDKPTVKVIDFGIAKATGQQLTDKTLFTGFAQMIGTPLYMSPEQAQMSGLDVDTRSDVYSLGVLLYELLTGTTPFDRERLRKVDYDELRRIIREEEPARPSTRISTLGQAATTASVKRRSDPKRLSQLFRGELDWIVMKALEKDRNRRYESASAFAADVERYLRDEPVLACPPSVSYRLGKFLRRNRGPVLAVAIVVLLLVAGVAGTSVGLVQAVEESEQKEEALLATEKERDQKEEALRKETAALQKEKEALQTVTTERDAKEQARKDEAAARARETRRRKEAERLLHASRLSQTLSHWEEGNVAAAREKLHEVLGLRLDDDQETHDTWEYRYLNTTINHHGQRTFLGHTDAATSVAFSPDGKRIASAGGTAVRTVRGQVAVWDAETGRVLLTLGGHTAGVTSVAFSPDGKYLGSASGESGRSGQVKVWDAATGQPLWELKHPQMVNSVAFSPDGKMLASGCSDWAVRLWDPATGKEVRTIMPGEGRNHPFVEAVAFSPDGKHVASVGDTDTVAVWETATGKDVWHSEGKGLDPPGRGVFAVAFSPDGKRLATGRENGTVKVWDAKTGKPLPMLQGHQGAVHGVAFSPDGMLLATASDDGTVRLWYPPTGQEVRRYQGHTSAVRGVAFSPDGRQLVSASFDRTVKVWNAAEGHQDARHLQGLPAGGMSVAFSPDGKRLAAIGLAADAAARIPREVTVCDLVTGQTLLKARAQTDESPEPQVIRTFDSATGMLGSVAFSPDGKRLALGAGGRLGDPGRVEILDTATGKQIHNLKGHAREVVSVAFSPDGKYLASASHDETVKVWDPATGKELWTLKGHADFVKCVAFSPDGTRLASGGANGMVKLWDLASGRELRTLSGHTNIVMGLAFSPDGKRLASASWDRTIKVWQTEGEDLLTLRGHFGGVMGVAFSPDGKRLASGSMDGTTRLWDASTGQDLLSFKEYAGWVTSVAFGPDGRQLASALRNGTVKLREAAPQQRILTLEGHRDSIRSVAFSPDGKRLASGSDDQTVKLWDAATGQVLLTFDGHTWGVSSVAFSADGKRLFSQDERGGKQTWDLATGKSIAGAAEKIVPGSPRSPDGRLFAVAAGKLIHIHRLPDGKEPAQEGWQWWIDPAPWWHAELARLSQVIGEWYAAAFHRGRLAVAANDLARFGHDPANDAYNAACYLCLCVQLTGREAQLAEPARKELAQGYADGAMLLLRQAVDRGFKDAAHMKKDTDLQPLRGREDFRKLIAELEGKANR